VKEIALMERCDWSVGQCLQTSNEVSAMLFTCGLKSLFSVWMCSLLKEKFVHNDVHTHESNSYSWLLLLLYFWLFICDFLA